MQRMNMTHRVSITLSNPLVQIHFMFKTKYTVFVCVCVFLVSHVPRHIQQSSSRWPISFSSAATLKPRNCREIGQWSNRPDTAVHCPAALYCHTLPPHRRACSKKRSPLLMTTKTTTASRTPAVSDWADRTASPPPTPRAVSRRSGEPRSPNPSRVVHFFAHWSCKTKTSRKFCERTRV